MAENQPEVITTKSIPFFLRVISIVILVAGSIGVVFYLLVLGYQIADRNFLYELRYKAFSGFGYYLILLTQLLLNVGLIISGVLLLKLKKKGFYVFAISYLVLAIMGFVVQDEYGWTAPVVGLLLLVIIALHYKKLT